LKEQLEQMNVKHTETLAQYQTERSKLKTKIKTEKSKEAQAEFQIHHSHMILVDFFM
jgi:ribosomal protein S18